MRFYFFIILFFSGLNLYAQGERDFYGAVIDKDICLSSSAAMSDQDVYKLISEMLSKFGAKNRYIIVSCPRVDNCLATKDSQGRPYILYNAAFLEGIKRLSFTSASLPTERRDWQSVAVLAHELGHHLNNHITNPLPNVTLHELELEADYTAGFILYLLKATLNQAQAIMYDRNVTEEGTHSHPPRTQRLETITRGYNEAKKQFPPPPPPFEGPEPTRRGKSPNDILYSVQLRVRKDFYDAIPNQIAYNYYLSGQPSDLDQIREVRYIRNHNTFPEFQMGGYQQVFDRASGFNFKGYQWGAIYDTFVMLILKDGSVSTRALLPIFYDN